MGFSTSPGTQPNLGASSISGHPVESSFTLPLEPGLGLVLSLLVLHMLGLLFPRMTGCTSSSMSFWGPAIPVILMKFSKAKLVLHSAAPAILGTVGIVS